MGCEMSYSEAREHLAELWDRVLADREARAGPGSFRVPPFLLIPARGSYGTSAWSWLFMPGTILDALEPRRIWFTPWKIIVEA